MLESWYQVEDCTSFPNVLFKTTRKDPYKETGAVKYKHVPLKQLTHLLSILLSTFVGCKIGTGFSCSCRASTCWFRNRYQSHIQRTTNHIKQSLHWPVDWFISHVLISLSIYYQIDTVRHLRCREFTCIVSGTYLDFFYASCIINSEIRIK